VWWHSIHPWFLANHGTGFVYTFADSKLVFTSNHTEIWSNSILTPMGRAGRYEGPKLICWAENRDLLISTYISWYYIPVFPCFSGRLVLRVSRCLDVVLRSSVARSHGLLTETLLDIMSLTPTSKIGIKVGTHDTTY